MVLILFYRWWYISGWAWILEDVILQRLRWCIETFSMQQLIKTWFAPFKQSYSKGGNGLDLKFNAFIDNTVSRFVGFFARSLILLTGLVVMILVILGGVILLLMWPLMPLVPLLAIITTLTGVQA